MEYSNNSADENVISTTPILPDDLPCGVNSIAEFYTVCLLASIVIIICLSWLEKRSNSRCSCAGQRPGIIYPVNLLDHGCDNFGYSMAFGSVASVCASLFSSGISSTGPAWSKSLLAMLYVLLYGLLFYPLFACLTTTWVFIGSLFGLCYTLLLLYANLRAVIMCPNGLSGSETLPGIAIATEIPTLVCLLCLFLRYAYILIRHLVHHVKERSIHTVIEQCKREHIGTEYNVAYVRELLVPARRAPGTSTESLDNPPWHTRLMVLIRRYLYKNDPTFKYSPRIICIFTVVLICTYQIGIGIILAAFKLQMIASTMFPHNDSSTNDPTSVQGRLFVHVAVYCMLVSFCVSSLVTVFSIFQILTNYRHNIKLMYKGIFSHLPFKRDSRHPIFIMSESLAYAGSQVAYTLWGYVIVIVMLFVTFLVLTYLIILPVLDLIPRSILQILWNILPGVVILQVVFILQKVLCRAFLQTRHDMDEKGNETTSAVLALNNRKLYHNVSYFLFFFYIVLGLFGCLLTIIKGVMLGIIYLARMDKCGLVAGYETWDRGYMYYVSFLHVEECHRHPVLLVFCDILLDNIQGRQKNYHTNPTINSASGDHVTNGHNHARYSLNRDRARLLARNRWFKAYTMIRNPALIQTDIGEKVDKLAELDTHAINRSVNDVYVTVMSEQTRKIRLDV